MSESDRRRFKDLAARLALVFSVASKRGAAGGAKRRPAAPRQTLNEIMKVKTYEIMKVNRDSQRLGMLGRASRSMSNLVLEF